MQAHHQVMTAVKIAASQGSEALLEAWLYEDDVGGGGSKATSAHIDVIEGAERLERELGQAAVAAPTKVLYAVVGGAQRTYGVVGSDVSGYMVADMLADNFPGGPVLGGYKTLGPVVEYMCRTERGNSNFTLEILSLTPPTHVSREVKRIKTEEPAAELAAPPAGGAIEPAASKPRKRAKESGATAAATAVGK